MTTLRPVIARSALIAGLALATFSALAQSTGAAPTDDTLLVHRFTLPPKLAWGTVSVNLLPGAWRIGHADGPPATEAMLRSVIGHLTGIEIGARCAGQVDGPTAYPCGFSVRELDFAGTVPDHNFMLVSSDWAPRRQHATSARRSAAPCGSRFVPCPTRSSLRRSTATAAWWSCVAGSRGQVLEAWAAAPWIRAWTCAATAAARHGIAWPEGSAGRRVQRCRARRQARHTVQSDFQNFLLSP